MFRLCLGFVVTETNAIQLHLARQIAHWRDAAQRLARPESIADPDAWTALEAESGVALRRSLAGALKRLNGAADAVLEGLSIAESPEDLPQLTTQLRLLRRQYFRVERIVDFYAESIRTRTDPRMSALLRACDRLARESMRRVLGPLGRPVPPVLCHAGAGAGAAILKDELVLWDGQTESQVAAIKVARQNLLRPTNVIHETGHQVAHILDWNGELATVLRESIEGSNAHVWAGWASEMAADAYSFVHTGYASVTGLHDVVAGDADFVFRHVPSDPHPISYIRVFLGIEMCRRSYGKGPWDGLAHAWRVQYPLAQAPARTASLLRSLQPDLQHVVELLIHRPMHAFGGRTLSELADPQRVSPSSLSDLRKRAGGALFRKPRWLAEASLETLALSGLDLAAAPAHSAEITSRQEAWMRRLGGSPTPVTTALQSQRKLEPI